MASEIKVDDIKDSAGAFTQARLVDFAFFKDGEVQTGTTTMPLDDTIPQNTEGNQFIALPAFTPKSAINILKITTTLQLASSTTNNRIIGALFQDSIVDAIATGLAARDGAANANCMLFITHYMIAGTTSPINFNVRAGTTSGGTTTFNGSVARFFGGTFASFIALEEFKPD